jgi:uncharacterized membrane protein
MDNFVHSNLGLAHLLASLLATVTGTMVLAMRKGTGVHKRVGYAYTFFMLTVNATALMIYSLFGHFGLFHYGAVFSLLTLVGGMLPVFRRRKGWVYRHMTFMYWSVIGLYAAFASEALTRIPDAPFFEMVGLASGLIFLAGALGHSGFKKRWIKQFAGLMR